MRDVAQSLAINPNTVLKAYRQLEIEGLPRLHRRIIRPIGLRHTEVPGTDPLLTGPHPHGYLIVKHNGVDEPVDITAFNPCVAGASGEIIPRPRI